MPFPCFSSSRYLSRSTSVIIIIASVILLFGISALLARGISRSLETEVPAGAEATKEDLYDDEEDK